jgi:hypothetical protein
MYVDVLINDAEGKQVFDAHAKKVRRAEADVAAMEREWASMKAGGPALTAAERATLEPLVGTWLAVTTLQPAEWTPERKTTRQTVKREWILNERFVLDRSEEDGRMGAMSVFGPGAAAGQVRVWSFVAGGTYNEAAGGWDAERQRLIVTSKPKQGLISEVTVVKDDADHHSWTIKVRDGNRRLMFHSEIATTRIKPAGVK